MGLSDNIMNTDLADQRDFWDSLQMGILSSNRAMTNEDYRAFIERDFLFSLFFRGFSTLEMIGYQNILNLKDNGYVIILDFSSTHKTISQELIHNELKLHHMMKHILNHYNCAIGPLVSHRIVVLITHESGYFTSSHKEESILVCRELIQSLEKHYKLRIKAGIGNIYNIHSIYSSFTDALAGLCCNHPDQIIYSPEMVRSMLEDDFSYSLTEKHLQDAVRLNKPEAYDYFGMLINYIRTLDDEEKRIKIIELLILTHHAKSLDNEDNFIQVDYVDYILKMQSLSGNQLIDYAYQIFNYITNYIRPQNSIDYSNHIVMATKEYLESHYAEDLSLEDMAAHVNISPQYFSKLIKKTTGFNFTDWLSMLRIKKAKELLNNSNLTVKEVCFMVGYKDPNYFSRIFKKIIGITPSEYVKVNSFSNKS